MIFRKIVSQLSFAHIFGKPLFQIWLAAHHGQLLRDFVTSLLFVVRINRNDQHLGLIQSRQIGAEVATSDVIVSLDAHMEVQEGWLVDLTERWSLIHLNLVW